MPLNKVNSALTAATTTKKTNLEIPIFAGLLAFLGTEYELLRRYLGEVAFSKLVRDYSAAYPNRHSNARWFANNIHSFLKTSPNFKHHGEIIELASFEAALNQAFNAPEVLPLNPNSLAKLGLKNLRIRIHPSVNHIIFLQNTTSIWSALKCDEKPPKPHRLDAPQHVLTWRQGASSRFRILGEEEISAFEHLSNKTPGAQTTAYLRGWSEAELVCLAEGSLAK